MPEHHKTTPVPPLHSARIATMSTPRTPFVCASCARALRQSTPSSSSAVRSFTTSVPRAQQPVAVNPDEPRWKQTPPAMRMPVRLRPQPNQPTWHVNDKPEPVDEAFDAFIGNSGGRNARGRDLLDEEVKVCFLTGSLRAVLTCIAVANPNPQVLRPRPPPLQRPPRPPRPPHPRTPDLPPPTPTTLSFPIRRLRPLHLQPPFAHRTLQPHRTG